MASSSLLPLRLHPPLCAGHRSPALKSPRLLLVTPAAASSASSSSSAAWEREEQRWQREEQRWLREEQRWLREESRWAAERDALLRELALLRSRLADAPRAALMAEAEAEVKEMLLEVKPEVKVNAEVNVSEKRERRGLRNGSEGEDVKEMQEALQSLGFYSGEEDMEYSSFSSGTERAVKTWQASLGITEDGIMTTELLERLLMKEGFRDVSPKVTAEEYGGPNGVPIASVTEVTDIQQTITKESGDSEVEISRQRVFLLGENRWEEPSRLRGRDNPLSKSKAVSTIKCLSCRGEGRLMCTECDGTGEPNIEPQFLEWIDGAKCPYCEGLGYTICDVCEGKATVQT